MERSPLIRMTRHELYDRVWATPTSKLCKEFGISDVGLAKLCKRHAIPKPPCGYWAKLQHGKPVERPRLPACSDARRQTIEYRMPTERPKTPPTPAVERTYDPDIRETRDRVLAMPAVIVPATLRKPHALVANTREALEHNSFSERNLVSPRPNHAPPVLDVCVAVGSIRRSLLFLDELVKTIERAGGEVTVVLKHDRRTTNVRICGETVATIRVRERYKQVVKTPNPKDPRSWDRHDYVPTGRLRLDGGAGYGGVHCRDGEKKRIEDAINRVLIEWVQRAQHLRDVRRSTEEERRRREEHERARREQAEQERIEGARMEALVTEAQALQTSRLIAEYTRVVEARVIERDGIVYEGCQLASWLTWARLSAKILDPTSMIADGLKNEAPCQSNGSQGKEIASPIPSTSSQSEREVNRDDAE